MYADLFGRLILYVIVRELKTAEIPARIRQQWVLTRKFENISNLIGNPIEEDSERAPHLQIPRQKPIDRGAGREA